MVTLFPEWMEYVVAFMSYKNANTNSEDVSETNEQKWGKVRVKQVDVWVSVVVCLALIGELEKE